MSDRDDAELDVLISRLHAAMAETRAKYASGGTVVAAGSVVFAGLAAVQRVWFLIPVGLAFGAAIYALMRAAIKNTSPERAEPVLRALREAPDRVVSIEHRATSDSLGMFKSDWIEVKTADGRLFVRAKDWSILIEQLHHRCPSASIRR